MTSFYKYTMYSIELKNVSFRYPKSGKDTLCGINLAVSPGEIVGLSGRSGTGKSTLADILLGLLTPSCGRVFWNSIDRLEYGRRQMRKERRFYQKIFQDPAASFPPNQTTGKAILDVASLYKLSSNHEKLYDTVLNPVGLKREVLDHYPNQLSGGEMQRLALARVMLAQPRFVVADEPTSMLDISVQAEMVRLLEQLVRKNNWSLLFISHDEELLDVICDRCLRLVSDGTGSTSLITTFCRH